MASERYSFSLTTFSPSGKLVQLEYALAAVGAGASSVGMVATDGVVIATENKFKSALYDEHSVHRVEEISEHVGMVFSGLVPDYRPLVSRARKAAQKYFLTYKEQMPVPQLVDEIAKVMQEYTQSGGVRPFGVSLLVCGWYDGKGYLFQCDPSGSFFPLKATAIGRNAVNGKAFLEKRYMKSGLDDAVNTALSTLKAGFEGEITKDNIEVGICNEKGFKRLSPSEVSDNLANLSR